jgi:hypothetical protein
MKSLHGVILCDLEVEKKFKPRVWKILAHFGSLPCAAMETHGKEHNFSTQPCDGTRQRRCSLNPKF